MEIIKDLNSDRLERKLDNGLIEVKVLYDSGLLWRYYFIDKYDKLQGEYKQYYDTGQLLYHYFYKNDRYHGECKVYCDNGQLWKHKLYENDKIIKDYLK